MRRLSAERERIFRLEIQKICRVSRMNENKQYFQHGATSIYSHSLHVAYMSCLFAESFRIRADYCALIRGAFCMIISCMIGMTESTVTGDRMVFTIPVLRL